MVAGVAGALYYPQAGIINPAEIAPIASIYLAVWVAIGGRGQALWSRDRGSGRVADVIMVHGRAARRTSTSGSMSSNGLTGGWCCLV